MILRWTTGALADLKSIEAYQRRHWSAGLAPFEARLAAIEQRMSEFLSGAPRVERRAGVHVLALRDFPYRLFYRTDGETIDVLAIRHTSRRPLFD